MTATPVPDATRPTLYEAAGGADGMQRLADTWHRLAYADPLVGHAFEHEHQDRDGHRIAAYLGEALGGPARYTELYGGETYAQQRHAGNGVYPDFEAQGIALFDQAVDECGYTGDVAASLKDYWRWATPLIMRSYPDSADDVPEGLAVPKWGWDGPSD